MNEIAKLLHKISKEDRKRIEDAMSLIYKNKLSMLDCKKLGGLKDSYRVRVGKFRIKFIKIGELNEITEVARRGDNTY